MASQVRVGWARRLQPYVGAVVLSLGLVQALGAFQGPLDARIMRALGTALLFSLGGLGLIFRAPGGRRRVLWFLLASVGAAAAVGWWLRGR